MAIIQVHEYAHYFLSFRHSFLAYQRNLVVHYFLTWVLFFVIPVQAILSHISAFHSASLSIFSLISLISSISLLTQHVLLSQPPHCYTCTFIWHTSDNNQIIRTGYELF